VHFGFTIIFACIYQKASDHFVVFSSVLVAIAQH